MNPSAPHPHRRRRTRAEVRRRRRSRAIRRVAGLTVMLCVAAGGVSFLLTRRAVVPSASAASAISMPAQSIADPTVSSAENTAAPANALGLTADEARAMLADPLMVLVNHTHKLERLLDKVVGERDNIPLPELFAAAGVDAARGRAAVKSAIEHGYFGADAYIDNRTDTLVVRGTAPQPKKPAPAPAPKPQPAAEDEYAALLRQLREVNDAIPDPVMSQKISRLEEVSGRIFALAQKDPDKKAQLQKFMNYYLPTALKLLNTYASLSGQAVEGTNITEAKHSIERSMDLLVTAFENQLDKLFQADALDVNADIAALEGMLNLDGLTGSEFTR